MIGAVNAVNETDVAGVSQDSDEILTEEVITEDTLGDSSQSLIGDNQTPVETTIKSTDKNIVKGSDFSVKVADKNGNGIANGTVEFTVNNKQTNSTTDSSGVAKLKIDLNPGTYTVKYSFKGEGYASIQGQSDILVIPTSTSKIKASDYTAYVGIKNVYTVTLTVGSMPLSGRVVTFKINGKTVTGKTDSEGKASININEAKGTYTLSYSYAGEDNIKPVSGTAKIKVKKGAPTKIIKVVSKVFRNKKAGYFKVKLLDVKGNPIKSKKVTFTLKGKKYTKKTNSKGIASLKIKLKTGSYKIKVKFSKTSIYNKASKTFKIKVKPKQARNNGIWLLSLDMKSVDFNKLQKLGTKHIFLNAKALERFGQEYVESWIADAKAHKIKVHLWMQVFYSQATGWVYPIKNGKIDYKLINSKVSEAKKYAKVKGVAGVHFDYIRFPGNAFQYKNSIKAINLVTKKAAKAVHKVNKKLIVSAAVMPEPSAMKKYYAQDIPTMSKYLDVITPMVYKETYHAKAKWITSVTKAFAKQSKKAKIWTGIQTYRVDSKLTKIPSKELMNDADAAALGGAYGVMLFRYGLINYINFNEV